MQQFVNAWFSTGFSVDESCVTSNGISGDPLIEREGIAEVNTPSTQRWLISFAWTWFVDYITTEMSTLYVCYISEHDAATTFIRLLGTVN